MKKKNERDPGKPEKPQWMVTSFAACTALGLLYGLFILVLRFQNISINPDLK